MKTPTKMRTKFLLKQRYGIKVRAKIGLLQHSMKSAVLHFLGQRQMASLAAGSDPVTTQEFSRLIESWCPLNMAATSTPVGTHWTKMIAGRTCEICCHNT